MRTRTTAYAVPETVSTVKTIPSPTCAEPSRFIYHSTTPYSYNGTDVSKVTNDVVTPGWHKLVRNGEIINNPYDRTLVQSTIIPCNVNVRNSTLDGMLWCPPVWKPAVVWGSRVVGKANPSGFITGGFSCLLPAPAINVEVLKDLAVTQAWAKADDSETLALVTSAESGKTINSFKGLFKRAVKITKQLKKGQWWKLRNEISLKELSSRWMEARYVVRPFLYDVQTSLAAFSTTGGFEPVRQVLRSHASESSFATQSDVVGYDVAGIGTVWWSKLTQRTVTARAGVLAQIQPLDASSIWGLNLPFETLWELTPMSFVMDWFLNVGKTIASWTPDLRTGFKPLASWLVVEDTTVATAAIQRSATRWSHPYQYENVYQITGGSLTRTTSAKSRVVNPLRPIIPTRKIRLDTAKLLDLTIILRNLLR